MLKGNKELLSRKTGAISEKILKTTTFAYKLKFSFLVLATSGLFCYFVNRHFFDGAYGVF